MSQHFPSPSDLSPEAQLAAFRAQIDAIDGELIRLFQARTEVVAQVGALKAQHWPGDCHIRPAREGQMHQKIAARFATTLLGSRAGLAIWRQLIGASTHLESPLTVAYLADFPEQLWMAREYFGVQVGTCSAVDMESLLHCLQQGAANILLLPDPHRHAAQWHALAPTLHAQGWRIFGRLPVIEDDLPAGALPAIAWAKLTPEDSGDDLSYHWQGGALVIREGFHPHPPEGALFLGAHPAPVSLSTPAA